jgi:hypothetical protein
MYPCDTAIFKTLHHTHVTAEANREEERKVDISTPEGQTFENMIDFACPGLLYLSLLAIPLFAQLTGRTKGARRPLLLLPPLPQPRTTLAAPYTAQRIDKAKLPGPLRRLGCGGVAHLPLGLCDVRRHRGGLPPATGGDTRTYTHSSIQNKIRRGRRGAGSIGGLRRPQV